MDFDFRHVGAPFRMQPGLRRLADGATQLTPASPGGRTLREKLAVLGAHSADALLAEPGFEPRDALLALFAQASRDHPTAWDFDDHGADAPMLGWRVEHGDTVALAHADPEVGECLRRLPAAWRLAALACLAFEEDFAIIDARTGRIPWLAVCLPSSWSPREKLSRSFAEIHAPVADNAMLLGAADHLTRLVTGPQRWERFVWTITRHSRLHAHPDRLDSTPWPDDLDVEAAAGLAYLRTERQTFIPVPDRPQAVFTIRVQVEPLVTAVDTRQAAGALHAALSTMSDAVLAYRGLAPVRRPLLDWLAARR